MPYTLQDLIALRLRIRGQASPRYTQGSRRRHHVAQRRDHLGPLAGLEATVRVDPQPLCWDALGGVAALPRWLVEQNTERFAVLPIRLVREGIHKQIFLGLRQDDMASDYLQSFVALARDIEQ